VKVEAWIFGSLTIFFLIVTPIYWFMTADASGVPEITGTVALILTFFLVFMIWAYLLLVARRMQPRPEDKKEGEIAEDEEKRTEEQVQKITDRFIYELDVAHRAKEAELMEV